MKYRILKKMVLGILFSCGIIHQSDGQQNIQFSQYIFNSISVNPAYSGYKEEWFAQMALRSQWTGMDGGPKTSQVSLDGIIDPATKRMGIGLQFLADALGPQSTTSLYASYAYRLQLDAEDTQRLSFGIGVGVTQYGLDASKLNPVDGGDQSLGGDEGSSFIPNARFGVYYYNPHWYLGASVMDLLTSNKPGSIFSTSRNIIRRQHMYLMTGVLFSLSDDVKLRPSLLAKEDFEGPTSLDLNSMLIFGGRFWVGGSYRTGISLWNKAYSDRSNVSKVNAIAGIAQFYVSQNFRIGYSYDHTLSSLNSAENGSHEITLGLTFSRKDGRLVSPRFF